LVPVPAVSDDDDTPAAPTASLPVAGVGAAAVPLDELATPSVVTEPVAPPRTQTAIRPATIVDAHAMARTRAQPIRVTSEASPAWRSAW
jgi:hypothetical protein